MVSKEAIFDFLIFIAILGIFGHIWRKWKLSLMRLQISVFMKEFGRITSNQFFDRGYSSFVVTLLEAFTAALLLVSEILEVFTFLAILTVVFYLVFGPSFFFDH